MTSLQAWEMNGREGRKRPGQAKPSGGRYGVAAVLGREVLDVHERWRRSMNLDTCTYMGPPRVATEGGGRWHGTGKGNHNLEYVSMQVELRLPKRRICLYTHGTGGVTQA